jgi:hypothetical protein
MIKCEKVSKILFIRGVYKRDCLSDDIFEKKILENSINDAAIVSTDTSISTPIDVNFVNYEKMPSTFNNIDTWKKKTNIKCWCCTLSFDTVPIFIPKVIEPITLKNKVEREKITKQQFSISVYGNFCSFGCAYHYIETHNFNISDKIESINKLKLLHKLFYNTKLKDIGFYPDPYQLAQYGGTLTEVEFREEKNKYKRENIIC